ncbi:MAG: hypothetical protein GYB68_07925 [Chloroflexi bacterium]|nr:hypothetical protein [Chloroflexota bacterium]
MSEDLTRDLVLISVFLLVVIPVTIRWYRLWTSPDKVRRRKRPGSSEPRQIPTLLLWGERVILTAVIVVLWWNTLLMFLSLTTLF